MRGHGVFLTFAALATLLFLGLGIWQVQRLGWKLDLIERVDARVGADPIAAPGPDAWSTLTSDNEYTPVKLSGDYARGQDTLVQAVTDLGGGFWVMTPLTTAEGWTVLVNRGFVAAEKRDDRPLPAGNVTVTGLLRMSQPGGAFLRDNDPDADRWYSRDIAAIAGKLGLNDTAPYFIDASRSAETPPVGGLTVIQFRNNHLSYALTWFAMAAGTVALTFIALHRTSVGQK
ncbi:SURF1 family protein [Paracoccus sp. 11-3]|uniref:SURF1-like protein n=1 Tax=Paracoccus amoyensis TaxID=2760093 RepID=A0A926JDT6_9RHOB|nr:SURF1 family protein [Paracoccus amoyensis]